MNQKRKLFEQRRSRKRAISEREERENFLIKKGILLVLAQLSAAKSEKELSKNEF